MNDTPTCVICSSDLWDGEAGRSICRRCEQRIDRNLQSIAGPRGLYARLALRTTPGKGGDGPAVSGTRSAGMPPNEHVLNLVVNGGIVSQLEDWVKDWAGHGLAQTPAGGRLQYRVDQAVKTLRLNLPQAAFRHSALKDFNHEVHKIIRACQRIIDNEKPPIQLHAQCSCGGRIPFTLNTDGETCPNCGTDYSHADILHLDLTERRTAA